MPRDARSAHEALAGVPLAERMAALVCSVIDDEPRAMHSVADIISVAEVMARLLPLPERAVLAWRLRKAADKLNQELDEPPAGARAEGHRKPDVTC